jgi:hypothetical protein
LPKQQSQRQQHHGQQGQESTSPSSVASKKNMQTLAPKDTGTVQDSGLLIPASAELANVLTPSQKSPSTAFLKRKSVFTGEDLLSQEAESFAEFLEENAGGTDISRIELESSQDGIDTNTSQERFLSAMRAADMDDDGFPSFSTTSDSKLNRDVFVSVADRRLGNKSPYQRPMSALSGVTTSIRSVSQTSTPFVSKSNSYDTSSWQSRASTTGDDKMFSPSRDPYCGGMVFSTAEDDDFTSDRSEDYSSVYSKKNKNKSTLEELQLDVLGAVQELARSASSNMMKFLQN